ncbi:MAG TPA: twin-arginine translocase subunit TatC [Longimicrobiaceae bacterium]|jgi:sec-independent protein translocase protein TatC|nr:twin-arginine translocase subunit TatC [Longimicrobiaceae bacterium]
MRNKGPATGEMPFFDHLEELRWRLIWSLGAVLLCTGLGFYLVTHYDVLGILVRPIKPFLHGTKLKYLNPSEPFMITLKLSIMAGVLMAFPIVIYQVWAFFSPALHKTEKKVIVPSLYLGLVLFCVGVAFCYVVVLPMTLRFTMGFQTESLEQAIVIGEYLGMVLNLLLAFGIVFELPIVLMVLSALGIVSPRFLAEKRRHAIVAITALCSIITPGDVVTATLMMMVPMILLYEMSIFLSKVVYRTPVPEPALGEA